MDTDQAAATLVPCIREVPGSNFSWDTNRLEDFCGFP
jgi:hypothetical protein